MESWINYSEHEIYIHLTSHTQSTPTDRKHDGADIRNKETGSGKRNRLVIT